jgi:signal transduction histidine kinase
MSDGLVAVDAQGNQTQVNQAAFTMLGQDEDGLAGQVELDRLLAEAVSKKAPAFGRIKAGPNLIFVQAAPLTDDNQRLAGAVALLHDVTEAERLEQTRRDYVANISHELRSPLTAMRALLEPLSDGMVTDKADQARYYDILLHENIRLTELINDLLELSRLQAGNLPVNLEKLKLLPLLEDILLRYSPQAADQDLKLKITDNSAFCPPVLTDPDRVEQVLVILVDNAMKYTPAGGKVELDLDWNDSQVLVHVKDTGSGIAAEDIKHVFDRFFKADRAHQQPGTGLGLSIAREILHLMDQEISVQSQAGQGATFTFTLKRADQANGVYDGKEEEQ